MFINFPALRVAAAVMALFLIAIQVHAILEYTDGASPFARTSLIAAIIALAVLPIVAVIAYKNQREWLGALIGMSCAGFVVYAAPATIDRASVLRGESVNVSKEIERHAQELERIEGLVSRLVQKTAEECSTGLGPRCRANQKALELAKEQLRRVKTNTPPPIEEKRTYGTEVLSWATGLSEQTLRYITALGYVVGLDIGIAALSAYAAHGTTKRRSTKRRTRNVNTRKPAQRQARRAPRKGVRRGTASQEKT